MPTLNADNLPGSISALRDMARREPITVLDGGGPTIVILSAQEYARLKDLDRQSLMLEDLPEAEMVSILAGRIPSERRYLMKDIPDEGDAG